jgi:hypothetical protein
LAELATGADEPDELDVADEAVVALEPVADEQPTASTSAPAPIAIRAMQ